jgi:hypothetical protein
MIQPYKEESLARFFEMNNIYNRSTPIYNIINPLSAGENWKK